jgi:hypothetical protein
MFCFIFPASISIHLFFRPIFASAETDAMGLCKKYFAASGGEIKRCFGACFLIFFRKNQKTSAKTK